MSLLNSGIQSSGLKKLLIIPQLKIHNANALSSPFTIGFPAMTAWLGAVHALQRKLKSSGFELGFSATGVVSHEMNLQTHKGDNDFVHSIIGTGNPLDKTGARSAFIEEARCHLSVTLVIECSGIQLAQHAEIIDKISQLLHSQMKMAGGDIQGFDTPLFLTVDSSDEKDMNKLKRQLMPGYALIERRELMVEAMRDGQDAMSALLDYLAVHHACELITAEDGGEHGEQVKWRSGRKPVGDKPAGWIVPIATGFHAISDLAEAKNQRDQNSPHRFAESVVTLGEFKMAHRFQAVEELLWRYQTDLDNNLYLCQQRRVADVINAQNSEFVREELYDEEFPDEEFVD